MKEIWKQLSEYPKYSCSSYGRIRNEDTGKILKGYIDNKGYMRYDLCVNGVRKVIHGHRAVANTFIPRIDGKTMVNHIDGNKANNRIDNLEWCTAKENTAHAMYVLASFDPGKNRKPIECIETGEQYSSACEAGRVLNINASQIDRCVRGYRKSAHGLHFKYI